MAELECLWRLPRDISFSMTEAAIKGWGKRQDVTPQPVNDPAARHVPVRAHEGGASSRRDGLLEGVANRAQTICRARCTQTKCRARVADVALYSSLRVLL